jgi:glycosyltransferase involved in cell wall biosynthesis
MVGRIEKQKNYSDAIQFLDINKNHLTIDIVGNGQEKDLINNLSIEKDINIKFLGNMEHQKLTELYHSYEYFLSTSYFEGNPKSILEALNSGCIVFASNIPSHRELIRDELNGFLFSNISELSKKFDIIQKNTLFKKKVSQNAIKSVEKNIIENIVDTMYFDYENLNLVNNLK